MNDKQLLTYILAALLSKHYARRDRFGRIVFDVEDVDIDVLDKEVKKV